MLIDIRFNGKRTVYGIDAAQDLCAQSVVLDREKTDERNGELGS